MKDKETHAGKKKSFLKLPRYTGGKKAFKEFVSQNLIYPEDALKNRIEGFVFAEYEVNDLGEISDIRIKKGIGYGCDEEVIRILSLMVYEPVHNRGLRVKSKMKSRFLFKLPAPPIEKSENSIKINYTITEEKDQLKPANKSYSYTINLG
jgi:TonB family protein